MTDATLPGSTPTETIWSRRTLLAAATLLGLVVIADWLFYDAVPGIGLVLFFLALIIGVVALHPAQLRRRATLIATGVAILGMLPLVEAPSFFGFLSALAGVSLLALAVSDNLPARYEDLIGTLTRFGVLAPARLIGDGLRLLAEAGEQKLGGRLLRGVLVWLVPAGCAAVFVVLFSTANPLIEKWLEAIRLDGLWSVLNPVRVFLWGFVALLAWPLLSPKLLRWTALPAMQEPVQPKGEGLVFGYAAIRNSLVLFNALFLIQSAMDLAYLWGGVRLPDGMTHAEYAHRGAYPLIVTAVLAGAFVLAAMRKNGPGETSPLIRNLVYLWIGQNVLLVISSMLRLDIYVEAYSLTELRLAAGIGMGLVAFGLVLIVTRIALRKSNRWLVAGNFCALAATLYGLAWLDVPALVSDFNVRHSYEVTGEGVGLDLAYMRQLGPETIPALDAFARTARHATPELLAAVALERGRLADSAFWLPPDWRSWTWRDQRLSDYLAAPVTGRAEPYIN
jgi:hypothetical protein